MNSKEMCSYCGKKPVEAKGLCMACYMRKRRFGTLKYAKDRPRDYSKEIIEQMQKRYPKFSKVTLCMVRNKEYGVDLSAEAKRYLKSLEET